MYSITPQTKTLVTSCCQNAATVTGLRRWLFSHCFSVSVWPQSPWHRFYPCLSFPSTPSPIKHSSSSAQWKYTVYNPKCSRSFWIINSPSDLLCRAVEYCLILHLAFPCSIRILRILQNQMVLKLRLPTHRGISARFCLRHNLLHLPPSFSWFYLLL